MRLKNLKIEDETEFPELSHLYNVWIDKTMFLSTGNCNVPEWDEFIECAKKDKKKFARFALSYLEDNGSDWMILGAIDEVVGSPIKSTSGYVNPNLPEIAELYKSWMALANADKIDEDGIAHLEFAGDITDVNGNITDLNKEGK